MAIGSLKKMREDLRDLGFGSKVAEQTQDRLLNRDGSFNVDRHGFSLLRAVSPYHYLVNMPWWKFFGMLTIYYLLVNTLFGIGYVLCGPAALSGPVVSGWLHRFAQGFFFSVQTITTVGYGQVAPQTMTANMLVAVELLFGFLTFAIVTGLIFARFSRPSARILFSRVAVIAPYLDGTGFEFRLANERRNQLVEVEVKVVFARFEEVGGRRVRRFYQLPLERRKVAFLPLHWTVVHPVDETSPIYGIRPENLREQQAEFLVLVTAIDDTFSQIVHARTSYRAEEVVCAARFRNMLEVKSGRVAVDLRRMHDVVSLEPDAGDC